MNEFRNIFLWLSGRGIGYRCILSVLLLCMASSVIAQPANDNCANAVVIPITSNGYGLGNFTSSNADLSAATVQQNEFFPVSFVQAGLTRKSVWYRFSLPVTRSVRVVLLQPGSAIQAGDVGFAVYRGNTCLPGAAQVSTTLTAIPQFGSTENRCTESGDYYIQVSARAGANGPINIRIDVSDSTQAVYDKPQQAYAFGLLNRPNTCVTYDMECQSVENEAERCATLPEAALFNKSTWHTFTTPASFEYVGIYVNSPINPPVPNAPFGYALYEGNAQNTPIGSLIPVGPCRVIQRSVISVGYKCSDLKPNTTYSIQLLAHQNFRGPVSLGITMSNNGLSSGASPILSQLGAANRLGNITPTPAGLRVTMRDRFGCNSFFSNNPNCPLTPASGILRQNTRYDMGVFFTFTLTKSATLELCSGWYLCSSPPYRLFRGSLSENCSSPALANLVAQFPDQPQRVTCLPPGEYTIQYLGSSDFRGANIALGCTENRVGSIYSNLGESITSEIIFREVPSASRFNLSLPGAIDVINGLNGRPQPLQTGRVYQAQNDTIGCTSSVVPAAFNCPAGSTASFSKAIYRTFSVADTGFIQGNTRSNNFGYMILRGNADSFAQAQNMRSFPGRLQGMIPITNCNAFNGIPPICLLPGTYTQITVATNAQELIGTPVPATFEFNSTRTIHHSPETAQDMGDIIANNVLVSDEDRFTCVDNAVSIAGVEPCRIGSRVATKAIYRQFYLREPRRLFIKGYSDRFDDFSYGPGYGGVMRLFSGKVSEGISTLRPVGGGWDCFERYGSTTCEILPAGWYTVVAYGLGPTATQPLSNLDVIVRGSFAYSGYVGIRSRFQIETYPGCPPPSFNRPHKASVDPATGRPYALDWGPNPGSTDVQPRLDRTITLQRERFDCSEDTAFLRMFMRSCSNNATRVAFYVFTIARESYLEADLQGQWGAIYPFDVRTDSARLLSDQPIQACQETRSRIQVCRIQPGTYTLVVQVRDNYRCSNLDPVLYIDHIGSSRFDHARNAYDFGAVEADGTYKFGRRGDVNPINPAWTPSNDFFYCTTGAQSTDPLLNTCAYFGLVNPSVYVNNINNALYSGTSNEGRPRRNLWYTFVADKPGTVRVRVRNLTTGRNINPGNGIFIYRSDADPGLTQAQLAAQGMADSTLEQGLTFVRNNVNYWCGLDQELSFYRDPCNHKPERYYVIVYADQTPVAKQLDVSIRIDTVANRPVKFDFFSKAFNIGNIGAGSHRGEVDNVTCATSSGDESFGWTPCEKSLWYKFTSTTSGNIRYRIRIPNQQAGRLYEGDYNIRLLRQLRENDSTRSGLQLIGSSSQVRTNDNPNAWSVTCLAPGTYYIYLSGCGLSTEDIYPEIEIVPSQGDFCLSAVSASLNGPGNTAVTALVDCHSIGTDYGEFNPTLSCPPGAQTNRYKSTWFRIDVGGRDTLDLTVFLNENTNAGAADIQYRMMTGTCGAMQEQSCVQNALTRNTYRCLAPGSSYYIQVFTPVDAFGTQVTGTVELNMSAVRKSETCQPSNSCLVNASFQPLFDCTVSDAVRFSNTSTFGTDIRYYWDFGYQGNQSTAVSPSFRYPALATAQTYRIRLIVENIACGRRDTTFENITIPGRPSVQLGADTVLCTPGASVQLDATSFAGATYQWSNGSGGAVLNVSTSGTYWVRVTYNGCVSRDTVNVFINPNRKNPIDYRALCNVDSIQLSKSGAAGTSYLWNTGQTTSSIFASRAGTYWVDLSLNGCTIRDTIIVAGKENLNPLGRDTRVCQSALPLTLNATVNGASGYLWHDNSRQSSFTVRQPGLYWVQLTLGGCTYRDSILVDVDSVRNSAVTATICAGANYRSPSGRLLTQTSVYSDTLRNARGCDSIITQVDLRVTALTRQSLSASICRNQNYTLPSGRIVSTAGSYVDTVRSVQGCDSLITTVALTVNSFTTSTVNRTLCFGQTYTRPGGRVVNTSGTYIDTLRNSSGCDSIVTSNLTFISMQSRNLNASVCAGQSYRMPAGRLVSTAGTYRDTLRSVQGCDSLETVVTLQVNSPLRVSSTARICAGRSFRLPSGRMVSTQQTYSDTLRSAAGCDSLISTIALEVVTPLSQSLTASICRNQNYTLPSGRIVSTAGSYVDTVRTVQGCDSLITTVALSVNSFTASTVNRILCFGQTYTRPGGRVVNISGTYIDTLRNSSGCDSIVTSNLTFITLQSRSFNASVCAGQSYRMPTGRLVSTAGIYRDTLRSVQGCDSLETVVTLQVNNPLRVSSTARICAGSSYRLPSGRLVSTAQTYLDTLRSVAGCDSLISTIALEVVTPLRQSLTASICRNQNYTLPSGRIVSTAGSYVDTVRTVQGCDSLITTVALSVNGFTTSTVNRTLCFGQTYTRPGGRMVNTSGTYIDTLRNSSGCDSIVTSIVRISPPLSVSLTGQSLLCAGAQTQLTATASGGLGQNYTYRWTGVNATGNSVSLQSNANTRVIVEVSDGCTLEPARDTLDFEVVPLPTARFTLGTKTVCAPYTLTARSEGQAPAGSRYHWNFGTGNAADSAVVANPGFTFRNAGTYIIRLRVTNPAGCVDAYQDTLVVYSSPAPEVQAVTSICTNDAVTFTDGGSGAESDQWRWNFGNGQLSGERSPAPVRFTRAGRYTITLIRSNAGGCAVTDNHVLVVDNLQADALASRTRFCDTGTVDFRASVRSFAADSLGDALQYLWSFGDGTTSTAASPRHLFARTGTYRVILTVASSYGCRVSDTLIVESIDQPQVRIEGPAEVCAGLPVQFSSVSERGDIQTWRWSLGDGQTSNAQRPDPVRFANAGSYLIQLIASSGTACMDTVRRTLVVRENPVIGFSRKSFDICRGESVQLQAGGGTRYEWTPAAGLSDPGVANPVASPTENTRYTVRVTNAFGCVSEDTLRINVSQPFTVTASPEQNVCAGERVTLNAAGAVRYQWFPAQGLSNPNIANPQAGPSATTTYRVVGYGADNCFTDTAEVRVNVIPLPTVFAGSDTIIGVAEPLQLRPQVSADVRSYAWTPSTFLSCTNCPTPTTTPTTPIQYRITVSNAFGCSASDDISITLRCSPDDVFIPNTFTPNGDGTNDLFYPRGRGVRTVEFLRIYNRWGEMVYERKGFALNDRTAAWDGTYKGERLASGVFVYTTRMICENNEVIELKGSIMIAR